MLTGDTIAAIASPPGRSARGVVRLSGPKTLGALERAFGCSGLGAGAHSARLRFERGEIPALVVVFRAPRSYTGEDAAEAQLPGNPALLERALGALLECEGVRLAAPGEFTARAYLSGRMSLEMAEGVAMTIAARSDEELAAAGRLLHGKWGLEIRALADEVASALALVEAGIDFTDQEDVVPIRPAELASRLDAVLGRVCGLLATSGSSPIQETEPSAALVGPPSAGKSTLFNVLLGFERSVVAEAPGTTRDVLEERLDLGPESGWAGVRAVRLLDLPGLDASTTGGASFGAQRAARAAIAGADVIVLCDPAGRFETPPEAPPGKPIIRVRTKADIPSMSADDPESIGVCALDGWNLGALRRALADTCAAHGATVGGAVAALLPRHRRALADAEASLAEALACVRRGGESGSLARAEVIAGAMRSALDALGSISGRIGPDDVIGRVFATFCVGK